MSASSLPSLSSLFSFTLLSLLLHSPLSSPSLSSLFSFTLLSLLLHSPLSSPSLSSLFSFTLLSLLLHSPLSSPSLSSLFSLPLPRTSLAPLFCCSSCFHLFLTRPYRSSPSSGSMRVLTTISLERYTQGDESQAQLEQLLDDVRGMVRYGARP